jgi:D-erythro-7,8-dihydroneopterin triphosphate epimerase
LELVKDRIFLENVRLKCKIGASEKERKEAQEVVIDLSLFAGLKRAGTADRIDYTIDYRKVRRQISEFVSSREFRLLEGLAEGIASLALKTAGVRGVTVKVRKARYSNEPSVGVEIERTKR